MKELTKEHNPQEKSTREYIENSFITGNLQILRIILNNILYRVSNLALKK